MNMGTPKEDCLELNPQNEAIFKTYKSTASKYDRVDAPWERVYRKEMRPRIIGDLSGTVLEAGVGTGRNLEFYDTDTISELLAFDLSLEMLSIAQSRRPKSLNAQLLQADATLLKGVPSAYFDWYVSTFMYCVMPDHLQDSALEQMMRVLKPGARFRILEIVYSKKWIPCLKQKLISPYVEWMFGARFDRQTLALLQNRTDVEITSTQFIKGDIYLLIEGRKR